MPFFITKMKTKSMIISARCFIFIASSSISSAFVFSPSNHVIQHPLHQQLSSYVEVDESVVRDTSSLTQWAEGYGAQTTVEFTSYDGVDMFAVANEDIPEGTAIMYTPANMFISSYGAKEEFGTLEKAEKMIKDLAGPEQLPMFYVFVKLLCEYEKGTESPWFHWLNSLPRSFDSGAAMTPTCYDCLPPLAAKYAMAERVKYINCKQALRQVDFITEDIMKNDAVTKWAYNILGTRSFEVGEDMVIVPMADMVRKQVYLCQLVYIMLAVSMPLTSLANFTKHSLLLLLLSSIMVLFPMLKFIMTRKEAAMPTPLWMFQLDRHYSFAMPTHTILQLSLPNMGS